MHAPHRAFLSTLPPPMIRWLAGAVLTWATHTCAAAPLPLQDAITQALASHPQIQQAQSGQRAAGFGGDAARWGRWPSAQVQAAVGDRYRESTLIANQPLWNAGRTQAAIDAADARTQVATVGVAQSAQDLAERTGEAYVVWQAARDRAALHQSYVTDLERLLGVIQRRSQAEVASPADVQQARVRVEQALANRVAAEGAVSTARVALEALMLPQTPLQQTAPDWPQLPPLTEAEALRLCEAQHPTLVAARAERAALGFESDERRSRLWPQLGLRYQHPLNKRADVTYPPRWQLTLEAQTDGALVTQSQWRADAERLKAAVQREESLRLQLQAQVRQAFLERAVTAQQRGAAQSAAEQAQALVASATRQFEAGRRSWLDLLNAVREAHEARLGALSARQLETQAAVRLHALAQSLPGLAEFNQRVLVDTSGSR